MREMTILIAIVIQLFIASFSSALLISLLSVYDPETISANTRRNLRVGVVTNDFNVPLVSYLQDRHLTVNLFVNLTDANRAFENRSIDVILRVPDDTREPMDFK